MPRKSATEKAQDDAAQAKSPSTQAGEFVREEIQHVREGKHGAKNPKQPIAIGLSKARRAGVALPPPPAERAGSRTRRKAEPDVEKGQQEDKELSRRASPRRSRAAGNVLKRSGRGAASKRALSRQAKEAASRRKRALGKRPPA